MLLSARAAMNIRREPLDIQAGLLQTVLRSVPFGFKPQPREEEEDEELRYTYTKYQDEELDCRESGRGSFGGFGSRLQSFMPENRGAQGQDAGSWFSGREEEREKGLIYSLTPSFLRTDEDEDFASACCPRLGFKQRLFGCACCFLVGQLIQFCSFGAVAGVFMGHPGRFACLYTMSNIMMMAASFFLSGPQAQCRKIKAKDRFKTSFIYFATMVLTMTMVFSHHFFGRPLLIMLCVAVQWMALVWYVLSFVPYGHSFTRRTLRALCSCLLH